MKKTYLKPEAEYVSFYSVEDVTDVMPLEDNAAGTSGYVGSDDNEQGWT